MKKLIGLMFSCLLVQCIFAQTPTSTPTATFPNWTAPEPRLKNWTVFAPKPTKGDNIFKGAAEEWLADAVTKFAESSVSPIKDAEVSRYVSELGANLAKYSAAPTRQYEFVVVNDEDPNAFSVGAGRIYINLGMLRVVENEDQLASIIGHEIGHDAFKHSPKTITRQLFWMTGKRSVKSPAEVEQALEELLEAYGKNDFAAVGERVLGWSRLDELQADKAGFYNIFKAGYNPEEMKNVFRFFVAGEKRRADYANDYFFTLIFGSHPPSSQRVTALKWESNWIKMPPKQSYQKSAAFDAMKARVKAM